MLDGSARQAGVPSRRRTYLFDGLGVSAGVVLGPVFLVEGQDVQVEGSRLPEEEIEAEIERFRTAVREAIKEVQDLAEAVRVRIDAQQAAIFEAHETLLSDPLLIDRTEHRIREDHRPAEYVFWGVTHDIGEQLKSLGDSYFSERSHDLFDVARRVLKFLRLIRNPAGDQMPEGCIVVAPDLGPSETAQLRRDRVAGFCTDAGGPTSHTAIMAKALGLPAVVGLDYLTQYVRTGDFLILDGTEGKAILNPTPQMVDYYRERASAYQQQRRDLSGLTLLPAITRDGTRIHMEANIEFANELEAVRLHGAEGIGLFRTEYFFIERATLPSEEEQEEAYRLVLESMPDAPVVFRTIDVGGDKISTNIPMAQEGNPFLGLRALRLCLAHPELFRCQLRPLLRAAAGRELMILLPMISGVEEVHAARAIIDDVKASLASRGLALPRSVLIGAMIEIPSAALQAELLAREVDFFSIGTNDLTQYTLAVDRVNKLVGHLYHETHPAVLGLIDHVARVSARAGIPLSVCGEMAGTPLLALLLVGLGVRRLSMSPSLIPEVKKAIRSFDLETLEAMGREALQCATPTDVRQVLHRYLNVASREAIPQLVHP